MDITNDLCKVIQHFEEGNRLFLEGNVEGAIVPLKKATSYLSHDRHNLYPHLLIGKCKALMNDFKGAKKWYKISANKGNVNAYYALTHIYKEMKDYPKMLYWAAKFIENNKDNMYNANDTCWHNISSYYRDLEPESDMCDIYPRTRIKKIINTNTDRYLKNVYKTIYKLKTREKLVEKIINHLDGDPDLYKEMVNLIKSVKVIRTASDDKFALITKKIIQLSDDTEINVTIITDYTRVVFMTKHILKCETEVLGFSLNGIFDEDLIDEDWKNLFYDHFNLKYLSVKHFLDFISKY